ncbi:MAG: type IV pilus modification PilV family protein [Oceanisphaera sp.]
MSLLEFVIGLVLLSIVLLGVTLFYANQTRQLDPVFQFRAVSLVEAVVEHMLVVKYDEINDPYQQVRCGLPLESGAPGPECSTNNTPTDSSRNINNFTVLDDFNQWCDTQGGSAIDAQQLVDDLGIPHSQLYQDITIKSCVKNASDSAGTAFKQVAITVNIKQGGDVTFNLRRYNIL